MGQKCSTVESRRSYNVGYLMAGFSLILVVIHGLIYIINGEFFHITYLLLHCILFCYNALFGWLGRNKFSKIELRMNLRNEFYGEFLKLCKKYKLAVVPTFEGEVSFHDSMRVIELADDVEKFLMESHVNQEGEDWFGYKK